jgi:cholesterol transport system auxiliary component
VKHAWILALLAVSGCVDLKASYPDRRFYTLEPSRTGALRTPAAGTVLRVRRFTASKLCDGSELVTRTGEATYETDFYNVFFAPPALMAGEQTQRWLSGSGLFGTVVGNGSSVVETHILEGNLVALHGDVTHGDLAAAVVEMQFMLVRVTSDPAAVLFQKTYRQAIPVGSGEPAEMVKGWVEGMAKILAVLEEDLAGARK